MQWWLSRIGVCGWIYTSSFSEATASFKFVQHGKKSFWLIRPLHHPLFPFPLSCIVFSLLDFLCVLHLHWASHFTILFLPLPFFFLLLQLVFQGPTKLSLSFSQSIEPWCRTHQLLPLLPCWRRWLLWPIKLMQVRGYLTWWSGLSPLMNPALNQKVSDLKHPNMHPPTEQDMNNRNKKGWIQERRTNFYKEGWSFTFI